MQESFEDALNRLMLEHRERGTSLEDIASALELARYALEDAMVEESLG